MGSVVQFAFSCFPACTLLPLLNAPLVLTASPLFAAPVSSTGGEEKEDATPQKPAPPPRGIRRRAGNVLLLPPSNRPDQQLGWVCMSEESFVKFMCVGDSFDIGMLSQAFTLPCLCSCVVSVVFFEDAY